MVIRWIFIFGFYIISAQEDYKGVILDASTQKPIPFVNIGILNEGVGTVADEEGLFHLTIDRVLFTTSQELQFSSLGYQTLKIPLSKMKLAYNEYPEILMTPETIALNEVVVTNGDTYEINDIVGYQNYGEKKYGFWKDDEALGGELATKIKVKKGLRKLNTLFFEVFDSPSDSILIRINLYDIGKSKTALGANLNVSNKNILYTIYPSTHLAVVDLTPYDIYVKDDFYVSLELLKVYGDEPLALYLAASAKRGTYSLRKLKSLGKWNVLPERAMAYHLNTTYFSNKDKRGSKVAKAQSSRKNISGFVFSSRRTLSNIKVTNLTTNEYTFSNVKGRYQIDGGKNDMISFEGQGLKTLTIKLVEKKIVNINLQEL